MNRVSFLLSVGLLSASAISSASFEMMLIADNTAGAQRIVRYDPVNRVQLGSFGTGFLNNTIHSLTVDQAGGRVFALLADNSIRVFDYNTGEVTGGFPAFSYSAARFDSPLGVLTMAQGLGSGLAPGRAFNESGNTVYVYDGMFYSTPMLRKPGQGWGAAWGLTFGLNVCVGSTSMTGGTITPNATGLPAWTGNEGVQDAAFDGQGRFLGISTLSGNTWVWSINSNNTGLVGNASQLLNLGTTTGRLRMGRGHGSMVYFMNGNTLTAFHSGSNVIFGTQTLSFVSAANMGAIAMVVAPEPATMAALGLGLVAFLRRRKR